MMNYQGSRIFEFVSNSIGLPIDQLNFILSQLLAIVFGLLFRSYLKPCPQNTLKRHLVTILVGIILGHFCFGPQMWHLFTQVFIAYLAIEFCPRQYVHLFIFVFSMAYLSGIHIYRQIYDYGNYTLDITSPMMLTTQKITSFAFAFYDGMRPDEKLTPDQRQHAIRQKPHIIEFLSYIFNFQGIIVGPLCFYQDYIDFINGNNILKQKKKNQNYNDDSSSIIVQPSVVRPLVQKLIGVFILALIFFNVTLVYTIKANMTPEALAKPIWWRFIYYNISASSQRVKYYIAWVLADAVSNASGLGFNGYDDDGNAKWDLVTNINIIKEETSTSMKTIFDNWNIQTQLWLRRIAYDRLSTGKTLGVFVLSAFWHGFYPGYYMTFVLCAFLVYSGRGIRRKVRPFFQGNKVTTVLYSIITWICTIFAVNYSAASFDLLEFWLSVEFYNKWFWFLHVIVVIIVIALPGGSTKPKKIKEAQPEKEAEKKAE